MATARLTITGDLSAEELQNVVAANSDYDDFGDITKAQNCKNALRALLAIPLEEMDHAGERAKLVVAEWRKSLEDVVDWIGTEQGCTASPRQFIPARDWRE